MDCDSEAGDYLYITLWSADVLYLQKRSTADLSIVSSYSMGACTLAELNARTYVACPHTPTFDQDVCYVFGRMNAPAGLANPEHIIVTDDGGETWASVENGLGTKI